MIFVARLSQIVFFCTRLEVEKYRDLYDLHTVINSRIYLYKLISLTGSFDCDQNLEINVVTNPQMCCVVSFFVIK